MRLDFPLRLVNRDKKDEERIIREIAWIGHVYVSEWSSCCRSSFLPNTFFVPRLKIIWADQAYQGQNLADWCMSTGDWTLEVVKRMSGARGWSQQPKRWIVERTFAWLLRNQRLVVDYERKVQTSETYIEVAMIRLLLARFGHRQQRVLHDANP